MPIPNSLQIYRGYGEADLQIFDAFVAPNGPPQPGFVVDFLGGKTRIASLYDGVAPLDGAVTGPPVEGDYHAEAVEWIGLLKSVGDARGSFVAMEWGAGWAPWLVAGACAARRRGIEVLRLYGMEADPHHYATMRQHFLDNDLPPDEHVLLEAAVGVVAGSARWPEEPDAKNAWGARPIRSGDSEAVDHDYLNGRVDRFIDVDIIAAESLLRREEQWNLLHLDIQGWEGEICRSCIGLITERVQWVIIGVHSRLLDGDLLRIFHDAGWILEHEKPTHFRYARNKETFESMVIADGTQVWRNPRITM